MGGITKHLMTGPKGNSEFCFPSTLDVPFGFALGNIEGLGEVLREGINMKVTTVINTSLRIIGIKDKKTTNYS